MIHNFVTDGNPKLKPIYAGSLPNPYTGGSQMAADNVKDRYRNLSHLQSALTWAANSATIICKNQGIVQHGDDNDRKERIGHFVTCLRREIKKVCCGYAFLANVNLWDDILKFSEKFYVEEKIMSAIKAAATARNDIFDEMSLALAQ